MAQTLSAQFKLTEVDGGGVLLDLVNGEYWQLNLLAAAVARRVSRGETPETIAEDLARSYPEATDRVHEDVRSITDHLAQIGAIVDE